MSDMTPEQAIDELRDLVRCRCHPGFKDRGLRDPGCDCDSAEAVEVLVSALPAVQSVMVRLVFSNADATPKTTVLDVSAEAVPDIMAWYGAYCAGDRYTVFVDGRNVPMDQNGEPAHVNETPKSEHDTANMLTPAKGDACPM